MKVQMGNFLVCTGACRMPDRQTIRRENRVDCARYFRDHDEDGSREPLLHHTDIGHVLTRYDQYMSRVVLAKIEERHRAVVAGDDCRWRATGNDLTKGAQIGAGAASP